MIFLRMLYIKKVVNIITIVVTTISVIVIWKFKFKYSMVFGMLIYLLSILFYIKTLLVVSKYFRINHFDYFQYNCVTRKSFDLLDILKLRRSMSKLNDKESILILNLLNSVNLILMSFCLLLFTSIVHLFNQLNRT